MSIDVVLNKIKYSEILSMNNELPSLYRQAFEILSKKVFNGIEVNPAIKKWHETYYSNSLEHSNFKDLYHIISEAKIKETLFLCLPISTWAYKKSKKKFSIIVFQKCNSYDGVINNIENNKNDVELYLKELLSVEGFQLLETPNLIPLTCNMTLGEAEILPTQFAYFAQDDINPVGKTFDKDITLLFCNRYFDKFFDFTDIKHIEEKSIKKYLLTWFKGHEFGHFISFDSNLFFWEDVQAHFGEVITGILQELISDLIGFLYAKTPKILEKNEYDNFAFVYLNEMLRYDKKELDYPLSWFHDTFSARIQLKLLSNNNIVVKESIDFKTIKYDEIFEIYRVFLSKLLNSITTIKNDKVAITHVKQIINDYCISYNLKQ